MGPTIAFLVDIVVAAAVCIGVVVYIRRHLQALLIELWGTAERASFWHVFSNVTLVLVPLIFGLHYKPELGSNRNVVLEMATQVKYVLVGFVVTFTVLALILFRFIPRDQPDAVRPVR